MLEKFAHALSLSEGPQAWLLRGITPSFISGPLLSFLTPAVQIPGDSAEHTHHLLRSKTHPFCRVLEKTSAASIGVEAVRSLATYVSFTEAAGQKRFILIPYLSHLSVAAQNALLKRLEEPRLGVTYLLGAAFGEKVMPTLLSRCQVLRLSFKEEVVGRSLETRKHEEIFEGLWADLTNKCLDPSQLSVFCGQASKEDTTFYRALNFIGGKLGGLAVQSRPQAMKGMDAIFKLISLEKTLQADRRHTLLCIFFKLQEMLDA